MANLRELRNRLASIKSTRKITSAMKMVAASRLRQAQEAVSDSGYYAASLGRIIERLAETVVYMRDEDISAGRQPRVEVPRVLVDTKEAEKHIVVVFSSSRGLCGAFNMNVVKKAFQLLRYLERENRSFQIVCVGARGYEMLKNTYGDKIIDHYDIPASLEQQRIAAEKMAAYILDLYEKREIDACTVVYNHFHSAISQEVRISPLVPLRTTHVLEPFAGESPWGFKEDGDAFRIKRESSKHSAALGVVKSGSDGKMRQPQRSVKIPQYQTSMVSKSLQQDEENKEVFDPLTYDFEPENPQLILQSLIPELLTTLLYRSMLDSVASENGARMTAMDNATNNAADIIDDLTLMYNRKRQSMITNELTEIISGAEAL